MPGTKGPAVNIAACGSASSERCRSLASESGLREFGAAR